MQSNFCHFYFKLKIEIETFLSKMKASLAVIMWSKIHNDSFDCLCAMSTNLQFFDLE